jgi:glc operon protein GlcG
MPGKKNVDLAQIKAIHHLGKNALLAFPMVLNAIWPGNVLAQDGKTVLAAADARAVIQAAAMEASKGASSSIFVVDASGALIAAERMDGAFPASAGIAQRKAETSAAFWQSTANLESAVNGGRNAVLSSGYVVMQGGIPLKAGGRVVGAIGVSGGTKEQDEAVAKAGAAAFVR